ALRRHRVPVGDTGSHLDRLRGALAGVGVALNDEDLDEPVLRSLAQVWLQEQATAAARREELERSLASVEAQLATLDGATAGGDGDPLAAAEEAVTTARDALVAAEDRRSSDAELDAEIDHARRTLGELHEREREAADRVSLADEQVQVASAV